MEAFVLTTLVTTTLWCAFCAKYPSSMSTLLSVPMFFPGLFALLFSENEYILGQILGVGKVTLALTYSILGGLFVILILAGVSAVDYATGWGTENAVRDKIPSASGDLIMGFVRAAGEEVGWRCYLLPILLDRYSLPLALLLSGVIWGLYHVPVMVLLTTRLKVPDARKTVFFQSLQCVIHAVPMAWLAMKSGYSLWAPTMMHYTWNRINPVIFGSVYTQEPGRIQGKQWLINGEGLAGCLALTPVAAVLYWCM